MPIRLSGLASGLDTEAIVESLVSAYSYKKDKYVKAQTKLSWKQDAWKTLNSKIYSLYNSVGTMRYSSNYAVKKATVSDTTKATATASGSAINGTQSLKISQLATTAYITGGKLDSSITSSSTLSSLGFTASSGTIEVNTGSESTTITVDSTTTINSFISKLKEAGLSASYDSSNQRIFVSASKSGSDGDFSISASDAGGLDALNKLGLVDSEDLTSISKTGSDLVQKTITYGSSTYTNNASGFATIISEIAAAKTTIADESSTDDEKTAAEELISNYADFISYVEENFGTKTTSTDDEGNTVTTYTYDWTSSDLDASELGSSIYANGSYDSAAATATKKELTAAVNAIRDAYITLADSTSTAAEIEAANAVISADSDYYKWKTYIEETYGTTDSDGDYSDFWTQCDPTTLSEKAFYQIDVGTKIANGSISIDESLSAKKIDGQDAIIELNGVSYTSSSNSITVNGLTIEALATTTDAININVANDTDALYDKIKDFLSSYNSLMNEMQELYNADSASDYEPLTDDEKAEMSETEIEKWEQKIKDSLLRRDTQLSGVISAMTTSMLKTYTVNGETLALSSFGIHTLGTLNAADNEGYAYHIDGDSEDSYTSGNTDKLRAALADDPDRVIEFMKQLTSGLYSALDAKMKSTSVKSVYTVYNDKEMASEYSDYTTLIKTWTQRIEDMEDAYYKKFAQMESALATLQSNSSSISSLLGG